VKVEDSTLAVVRALERMGVRYYVGGSIASSLHGEPRATNDADLIAVFGLEDGARLQKELGSRFYVDPEDFKHAVMTDRSFNLIDEVELAKVDVFCVQVEGYQAQALARAVKLELEADDPFSQIFVASAEDVIVSKLRWYRLGGEVSDRQWRDLQGVLAAQAERLDLEYIKTWCDHFRQTDLLDRLLASPRK
jgi:hypothetical protein